MDTQHSFYSLSPDTVVNAVESIGYQSDLRVLTLNSYENRVYQVGLEEAEPIIAKFYRPERWSDAQILEEQLFSQELYDEDISVVAPLKDNDGNTLHRFDDFRFSVFPRRGGHAPEFDNEQQLKQLGTVLARLHAVGGRSNYKERPAISIENFATENIQYLSEHFIPHELQEAHDSLCANLLESLQRFAPQLENSRWIRTHGDCHVGNILWRNEQIHLVDLDDSRMAPAIQDLWMFLSGDRSHQQFQLKHLLEGYREFYDFDPRELHLIETLRTLRLIHYAAWLARRWDDPAFPLNFPWFNTTRYWSDHILTLREQLAALNEEPLTEF